MKTKRTLFAAAITLALASTSVTGQGVKMTDEQLDQVTAAGVQRLVLIINPGNANRERNMDFSAGGHAMCINCAALPTSGKTSGVVMVRNHKFTVDNTLIRCVGGGIAAFC